MCVGGGAGGGSRIVNFTYFGVWGKGGFFFFFFFFFFVSDICRYLGKEGPRGERGHFQN